ncbi:hypothetical protein CR513_49986, partial [Mucuna pruriens]
MLVGFLGEQIEIYGCIEIRITFGAGRDANKIHGHQRLNIVQHYLRMTNIEQATSDSVDPLLMYEISYRQKNRKHQGGQQVASLGEGVEGHQLAQSMSTFYTWTLNGDIKTRGNNQMRTSKKCK